MAEVQVKARKDFRNNVQGGRSKGDKFPYDVEKDPQDLVKLGLLELPSTERK